MNKETVTLNGIIYDAQTGLPMQAATPAAPVKKAVRPAPHPRHQSQGVHHTTQKSATLNRAIVKKTTPQQKQSVQSAKPLHQTSPHISKFAKHPADIRRAPRHMDIAPATSHPLVVKAQQRKQAAHAAASHTPAVTHHSPSHVIKQQVIAEAMEKTVPHTTKAPKVSKASKHSRRLSMASASLAFLLLAGYFTYLSMPNLSVRVAAAQAGFEATYPGYQPDGYRLNGPVAYNNGWVSMEFAANGGPQNFTVKQEKSAWDSSALLANYVDPASRGGYVPHSEKGLTVYVFNNNAAWVNGGIKYTIEGNAPLSSSQIMNIATSM